MTKQLEQLLTITLISVTTYMTFSLIKVTMELYARYGILVFLLGVLVIIAMIIPVAARR